jgi:putative ATP-dependent endonuclease of OLD family
MYLKHFNIRNFRSIETLSLTFNKGVNIIIGENNSGKTAIIDALRICFCYGNLYRDIFIDKERDFYIEINNPENESTEIRFDLIFEIEDSFEASVFTDFISQDKNDTAKQTIQLHFKYYIEIRNEKRILRWGVWGGDNEGQIVPTEALQLIHFTYLSPLRDAVEKLRPHARGNKIAELYKNLKSFSTEDEAEKKQEVLLNPIKKDELANTIQDAIDKDDWQKVLASGESKVQKHLSGASIIGKEPEVKFNFLPYSYDEIVNNIAAKTPIGPKRYFDIKQNGLGENNLIYAATVLGDLISEKKEPINEKEYFYNALLIEEPEAHLHPQKQNTFFNYLNTFENNGLQLFITSHSPTITAKANLDYLIVLQKQQGKINSFSISNSELSDDNKKYLAKFLDVTKAQLFFSNGTILVEGISEALLMPIFAKKLGYDLNKYGIEIVNIGGVAFEHFAKLYNSPDLNKRLSAKCGLITDDDRGLINKKSFKNDSTIDEDKSEKIFFELKRIEVIDKSNRVVKFQLDGIENFKKERKDIIRVLCNRMTKKAERAENALNLQNKDGNLLVRLANTTFEYELFDCGNSELLINTFNTLKKRTIPLPETCIANQFLNRVKNEKSEFAHKLAIDLEDSPEKLAELQVPEYIKNAIEWVIPK